VLEGKSYRSMKPVPKTKNQNLKNTEKNVVAKGGENR